MPSPRQDPYRSDLQQLISRATTTAPTTNNTEALEGYLTAHSALPGPRMNIALASTFADVIGRLVTQPDMPPVDRLEALLDGWAELTLVEAPANDPREILPSTAALTYGQVAVARPDWWNDEVRKLRRAASHRRWRVREMVAAALQRMLAADWQRTYQVLTNWLLDDDPLVIRASAAAIAEPPLLKNKARGDDALFIQARAVEWLARLPQERRREEAVGVLRKALGYTLSVATAATPEAGLALLVQLSASADKDIQWIVRENLKKQRLKPYLNELST
jgi:hypothetical protein